MTRTRKPPVTHSSTTAPVSRTRKATRTLIRKFHVLLKEEAACMSRDDTAGIAKVREQLQELGGLEAYQSMSNIGQGSDRGGGTEKVLIEWLPDTLPQTVGKGRGKAKVELLEVGALRPDNYDKHASWISNTPIDLNSRHPRIQQQDFLLLDPAANKDRWDVISLSLVINFMPEARDRGALLRVGRSFLRPRTGLLYLVVPAPCIENSRYLDRDRLSLIFTAVGLTIVQERLKPGGKLAYFLARRTDDGDMRIPHSTLPQELTTKVSLKGGASRNNFSILL